MIGWVRNVIFFICLHYWSGELPIRNTDKENYWPGNRLIRKITDQENYWSGQILIRSINKSVSWSKEVVVYLCGGWARKSSNLFIRWAICLQDGGGVRQKYFSVPLRRLGENPPICLLDGQFVYKMGARSRGPACQPESRVETGWKPGGNWVQ